MTFRDYAQGAFRMRGIGKGQTIELFVIPEVMRLVSDQFQRVQAGLAKASQQHQPAPPPATPSPNSYGSDLLSLTDPLGGVSTSFTPVNPATANRGRQLLINVAAWLTVNGMKSENMQFRMLCHQSIDNVTRKKAYKLMGTNYRELTQLAFASRVKEYLGGSTPNKSPKGKDQNAIAGDLEVKDDAQSKLLFADDADAIRSVVYAGTGGGANRTTAVGIEMIQQSIDILTERLDFTVQNSIPMPVPLSDTLRNSILRRKDFIATDYDKAIVDKILMVLVNSEGLAKKKFGDASVAEAAEEEQDVNLQKEQVAEEEVLKEQVSRVIYVTMIIVIITFALTSQLNSVLLLCDLSRRKKRRRKKKRRKRRKKRKSSTRQQRKRSTLATEKSLMLGASSLLPTSKAKKARRECLAAFWTMLRAGRIIFTQRLSSL
jgi:hypothetical protein